MEKFKLLLLTIIVLFLTGCSDYRELTDMSIVSSIGIDIKDGKYVTISQILSSTFVNIDYCNKEYNGIIINTTVVPERIAEEYFQYILLI